MTNTFDRGLAKLRRQQAEEAAKRAWADPNRRHTPLTLATVNRILERDLIPALRAEEDRARAHSDSIAWLFRRHSKPHRRAVGRGDRIEALIRGHQEGRRSAAGATQFRSFDAFHATLISYRELVAADLLGQRTFTLSPIDDTIGVGEAAAMADAWDDSPIERLQRRLREGAYLRRQANDNHRHTPLDEPTLSGMALWIRNGG